MTRAGRKGHSEQITVAELLTVRVSWLNEEHAARSRILKKEEAKHIQGKGSRWSWNTTAKERE